MAEIIRNTLIEYSRITTTGWWGLLNGLVWLGLGESLIHATDIDHENVTIGVSGIVAAFVGCVIVAIVFLRLRWTKMSKT